jgi:phosphatidate cytidylyltransferase
MILTIYIIILVYFILGGISFYYIYRNKEPRVARENRNKFISYLIIIHTLFFSIVFNPVIFHYLALLIIFIGLVEAVRLFFQADFANKKFFSFSLFIFMIFSVGFICFSRMDRNLVLFTFLIISIFDAFSQISGQLMGRHKIFPSVSPGKTFEGLIGGAVIAIASSFLLRNLGSGVNLNIFLLTSGIVLFAFLGDAVTSLYKRRYDVKDFSNLIPGHGGILDRFDSLVAGATFITILDFLGI